jgi:acid phosphatase (class A)
MKHKFSMLTSAALVALALNPVFADPLLKADEDHLVQLLPPPPADGSDTAKAEMDELHKIEKTRTDKQFAAADWDFKHEDVSAFVGVMGPDFDLARLPKTAELFDIVKAEAKATGKVAKNYFKRNRPWVVDPTLKSCDQGDPPQSSYPSGHATLGYSTTVILGALVPAKAEALKIRADQYAENRLVCSMHYRKDIVAGEILGTAIAVDLLQNTTFKAKFDDAKTELVAAGITP